MNEKKLGLGNVVSISVGLVVATSCLVSLGNGAGTLGVTFILAMAIAMLLNMTTVASLSELNALMPNTTGGIAQYTLAALGPFPTLISMVGGYIICNTMSCGVEASIFSFSLADVVGGHIPSFVYTLIMIMEVDFCPVLCIPEVPVLQAFRGISHFVWYCKAVPDLS